MRGTDGIEASAKSALEVFEVGHHRRVVSGRSSTLRVTC